MIKIALKKPFNINEKVLNHLQSNVMFLVCGITLLVDSALFFRDIFRGDSSCDSESMKAGRVGAFIGVGMDVAQCNAALNSKS